MRGIADTGFLVAFANGKDRHHEWALHVALQFATPLLTCDAVLSETAFHVSNAHLVMGLVEDGFVHPAFRIGDHIVRLRELAARYSDRAPDLADLCLIRMSELHPELPVITTDVKDFRIYRRGHRQTIPLIHPPNL